MKYLSTILAVCAVMLFSAATVRADEHDGPCKADREKSCKDVQPGGGAVIKKEKQE